MVIKLGVGKTIKRLRAEDKAKRISIKKKNIAFIQRKTTAGQKAVRKETIRRSEAFARRQSAQKGSVSRGGRTFILRGLGLQAPPRPAPPRRRRRRY